ARAPALLPRQVVARVEPGDSLRVEGVALGPEGLRRVERVQVQVDLAGAPRRLVADRRPAARAVASRHARLRPEGRALAAERDARALEVHEAGHRGSRVTPAARAVAVGDPARLAFRFEAELTTQAMPSRHLVDSLPGIGPWCRIRARKPGRRRAGS